jgi:hypothetical protein
MRLAPILPIVLAALALGACSRSDANKLKNDTAQVGHDVAGDVRKAGENPDVKNAGDQLKAAGQDVGQDLSKAGSDIGAHAKAAGENAREAVNKQE